MPDQISEDEYLATWRIRQKINQLTDDHADVHLQKAREVYQLLTPLKEQNKDASS